MPEHRRPKWTIMVYLAGDNNLTTNCISVLQQLEAVKYNGDEVRVLACFDSNTPAAKGARYVVINAKRGKAAPEVDWEIHNDLVQAYSGAGQDYCEQIQNVTYRSPSYTTTPVAEGLRRFLHWAMTNYKESEHYMLILYGHGPVVAGKTFLNKENPPSSLRFEDIQGVLKEHFGPGKPSHIDILAFQNCAMNGIETAFELKDYADFMIGSQGLVLAAGWPYEKMISSVVQNINDTPREIAHQLLKICARNLLDFVIMERSSEQSVCDLTLLRNADNIVEAIKNLVSELTASLGFTPDHERLSYPLICNAVRLARLEAQSYWGETFVDLYDFCERLFKRCRECTRINTSILGEMGLYESALQTKFHETETGKRLARIMQCCNNIMDQVQKIIPRKTETTKPQSFYIGSELQYSHGLSIYFPWTLPAAPYFFTENGAKNSYTLKTAFDTYCDYRFVRASGWGDFLFAFFKATLRKVRRANEEFTLDTNGLDWSSTIQSPGQIITIELSKSSSDTGAVDHEVWSNIKNYPRRNYLFPADCKRKIDGARCNKLGDPNYPKKESPPVSYLGWNVCDLVAETITVHEPNTAEVDALPNKLTMSSGNDIGDEVLAAND